MTDNCLDFVVVCNCLTVFFNCWTIVSAVRTRLYLDIAEQARERLALGGGNHE